MFDIDLIKREDELIETNELIETYSYEFDNKEQFMYYLKAIINLFNIFYIQDSSRKTANKLNI